MWSYLCPSHNFHPLALVLPLGACYPGEEGLLPAPSNGTADIGRKAGIMLPPVFLSLAIQSSSISLFLRSDPPWSPAINVLQEGAQNEAQVLTGTECRAQALSCL